MAKRSRALIRAQEKYDKKRAGRPRLPATYLSEQEDKIFQKALKITGKNKKDTIVDGLSLIKMIHACRNCTYYDVKRANRVCGGCIDFDKWELKV